jgi:hypothetical protein
LPSAARPTAWILFRMTTGPVSMKSGADEGRISREKKVLALLLSDVPGRYPDAYEMPLGWPRPSWGKWQLHDVYVIGVSKLPKYASNY